MEKSLMTQAAELTLKFKEDMKGLLAGTEFNNIFIQADAQTQQILNRLNHLSGVAPTTAPLVQFKPMTDFMGEKIIGPKQVTKEDYTAGPDDFRVFKGRVDRLKAELPTLHNSAILNGYTLPEDQLVVRGVAKIAGVENFEEREIDEKFIEEIRKGLEEKEDTLVKHKEVNEKILAAKSNLGDAGNSVADNNNEEEYEHEITEEDLKNNPQLNSISVKVGDKVMVPHSTEAKVQIKSAAGKKTTIANPKVK